MESPGDYTLLRMLCEATLRERPGKMNDVEMGALRGALNHVADYCAQIRKTDFAEMSEDQQDELFRVFLQHYRRKLQRAVLEQSKADNKARLTPEPAR